MKYLKLYEQFSIVLEKLDSQAKLLFLLCGPSATGKTYLAGQLGIKHWTEISGFKGDCLITTDGADGEAEKIAQLLESNGCPKLAEISKSGFGENAGIFMITWKDKECKDAYKKWEDEADEAEKNILRPLFDMFTEKNSLCPNTNQQDTRVFKLAMISYLWGPGRIVFDDVRPTINKFYDDVKESIIYTPLTTYLSNNLTKRLKKEPEMNVKGKLEKFFEWFQLSETVDDSFPDKTKYTLDQIEESMKDLNIKIKDFIAISKITDNMKTAGFYFKKGGIQGDKDKSSVFNSRSGDTLSL